MGTAMPGDRIQSTNDAVRETFNRRATFYRTSPAHTDPQLLARLVAVAAPRPGWTALDLATGAGHTARALAPHVRHVVGFDLTPGMLAQSASLARDTGLAFDLCQGDVHRLPFPSGAFDLVTCRRAAHHFADLGLALREVRRALRPGGRLVIDDRSVPEDEAVAALMNRLDVLHDPSHVREYPPSVWRAMLTEAGFDVDHLETYDRLRPLRDLTAGATPAAVGEIQQLVEGMEPAAAEAFGRVRRDGEWQVRHWFVLLGARS